MIHDKNLEHSLNQMIDALERKIDNIGPTRLRHNMSEQVVNLRITLKTFNQDDYERVTDE